ncbi:bifunctional (p)ppGpp synthetase/guanosine-3',5'-bis(diphosphate) 3'-pyrophosphohydrolase [Cardinium endosymbiont of Culicoides punctatus]|uniref:bifunctional (p)ppGpp synthetase/guanosine-3',5'-bis(diphosphate) 3'-pyrophosphohydrolase n=1 Tax=Cardinium endosymbiont of Culicoides punctatus TaxID=2304601 RepID=UPI0010589095|nr:bifunctional (p)ppGpp synthetase/guanosine-3',5'-bis(diphosphate) 3'-pyrophosphohydrolase [Cardinium endosymbiont of Culicoides punctatus]TDG95483.1 GTP pyrophosphokinase [Cardinium endosymbiont of Culicoides punctatus]
MGKNDVLDIGSWDLHQLARVLANNSNDLEKTSLILEEAYLLASSFDFDKSKLKGVFLRCPKESLQVAIIAATEMSKDISVAIAAILSPPFLSGLLSKETIESRFGSRTSAILEELRSLKNCRIHDDTIRSYPTHPDINLPHILAILLQICDIIRIKCSGVILENSDLGHNLSDTQLLLELKYFYIPLAHRMRLYDIQAKLADFWLKHSDTLNYYVITAKLGITKLQRQKRLELVSEEIKSALKNRNVTFKVKNRVKSVYSIWNKIQRLKVGFEQIYDLAAVRIILTNMDGKTREQEKVACWKVFTIISKLYKPMYHVMRDWVSLPRESGYESLHLTLQTNQKEQLEVQIRTERMDYIAEFGNAAHWKYKSNIQNIS